MCFSENPIVVWKTECSSVSPNPREALVWTGCALCICDGHFLCLWPL
jgi:hypothetical protein